MAYIGNSPALDETVSSSQIVDLTVDTADIAADAITGAKIADDAIDSEHYTDASIDEGHIADNAVTLAKMAGLARGKIIYGDASGDPAALALGTDNHVLTVNGSDINWEAASSFNADAAQVFNESGADADFRVEASGEANALFVQGSDGFVGIGTNSPAVDLQVDGKIYANSGTSDTVSTDGGATQTFNLMGSGGVWALRTDTSNAFNIDVYNGGAEKAALTVLQSGNVGIGTDSPTNAKLYVYGDSGVTGTTILGIDAVALYVYRSTAGIAMQIQNQATSGTQEMCRFVDGAGHDCGSIDSDTGANTTAYNTSSDYRLKENVISMGGALDKLSLLKPYNFNFIRDKTKEKQEGFFAHEVQEVVPTAITGEKDAMAFNDDGTPDLDLDGNHRIKNQKIDHGKLVPMMVKAIQELSAKVEALENA
jgi:hypothetical protein